MILKSPPPPSTISKERLAQLLQEMRAKKAISTITPTPKETQVLTISSPTTSGIPTTGLGRTGEVITYNAEQQAFISLSLEGKSCILIGAAGTGKTTCQQGAIQSLDQAGKLGKLDSDGHKYLPSGTPGVVVCAFTRRATNNIRRFMPENLKNNCITIHKLLEYEPVFFDIIDPITGKEKTTMKFEPTRNHIRPLSPSIHTLIIEEASMVSVDLYKELQNALPHRPQIIFLGDIQQLPPVFGPAILGFKMLELPTIELTQVYRQALESPIIRLAHRILSGNPIPSTEFKEWYTKDKLTLHPWKKKIADDSALFTTAKFFCNAIDHKVYDIEEDIILIPYNKACGTDELNKHLAWHLAKKKNNEVFEIIAGFRKHYFSVGDKVLFDREDAIITKIQRNLAYYGKTPQKSSPTLDYWGHEHGNKKINEEGIEDVDFLLTAIANNIPNEDDERVRESSHVITLDMLDSGREIKIKNAGEMNTLILGYALTVHKSQGSEWRKVFLVFHQSHAKMIQRELLYTAVTRAKEELYVICEPETFINGIKSQRIKGNTLAEKAEFFKGSKLNKTLFNE